MKNIMKLVSGLLALSMLAVSCDVAQLGQTSQPYERAIAPDNNQVYFPADETEVGSLKDGQTSVTVNVYRVRTEGELTVNVTSVDVNKLFTIPQYVKFANGSDKAEFVIGVPFDKIVPETDYPVSLSLGPEEATPFGNSSTTVIIKYSPWSEWALYKEEPAKGIGDYTYSQMFSGVDSELEIYYSQSLINPTQYKFSIEHCMYDISLEFTYDAETGICHVPETYTGYDHPSYGAVYCREANDYEMTSPADPSYFDAETGTFYLNLTYYVPAGYFGSGYETFQLAGFYIPDYSVKVGYVGLFQDPSQNYSAVLAINKGESGSSPDIDSIKVAVGAGEDPTTVLAGILGGTLETVSVTESGEVRVPFPADAEGGLFTAVAISMDKEGNYQEIAYVTFEAYFGGANPWQSIGFYNYTDDVVGPLFEEDPITYPVEVLVNDQRPGIFRMKNPYGAGYPYNSPGDYLDEDVFVDINAEDPEEVFIPEQYLGVDWGYGEMIIGTSEAGTLQDSKITFPVKGLVVYDNDGGYYANKHGAFCLDLSTPVNAADAVQYAPAKYRVRVMSNVSSLRKPGNNSKPLPKTTLNKKLITL